MGPRPGARGFPVPTFRKEAVLTSTLFMIHGMWGGPFYWARFRSALEPLGWRCVATTLPFHDTEPGAPPDPRLGRTGLLEYAAALDSEIEALDEPPILIGHSMGGLLAQMLCARGRARAAVLLAPASPAGIMAITPSVLKNFLPVMSRWGFWRKPMRPSSAADSMLHLLPPAERSATRAQFVPESGRAAAEIGLWPLDRRHASRVDPAKVTCPLLVIAGTEDRITPPRTVRQVARRYGEHARYREFEGHGHWLMAEPGWESVAACVADWLAPFR